MRRLYDDRPTADLFPAYDLVLPGRDGGVLVRSFHRPRQETRPPWLVFDRDGRLEARLELPGSFHPFQLGDGWVLGVERDGMDVEYVRRYDLVEAGDTGQPGNDDGPG